MYRTIDAKFWTDPKVRTLASQEKLLFLYLITNQHGHVSGLYYLPKVLIQHETGLSSAQLDKAIDTLSKGYLAYYDGVSEVVWVRKMLRYQGKGGKILLAVAAQLTSLHNCSLIQAFLEEYEDLRIPYRYPIDTPSILARAYIQEQEQEQEQKDPPIPPSPSEGESVSVPRKPRSPKAPRERTHYDPDGFERFYAGYPRKTAKQDAMSAWDVVQPPPDLQRIINENVPARTNADPQWLKNGGESIPYPATYLRNARWTDEWRPLKSSRQNHPDEVVEVLPSGAKIYKGVV